jgi:hypothetical protein
MKYIQKVNGGGDRYYVDENGVEFHPRRNGRGELFYVDPSGNVLTEETALKNLANKPSADTRKESSDQGAAEHLELVESARERMNAAFRRVAHGRNGAGAEKALEESATDTATANTLVGHFVKDQSGYGSSSVYKVSSVDTDGSATLHGPIGKGGTKTVSHRDLAQNYADLGCADTLSQVNESARERMEEAAREQMEEAFRRFAPQASN